MNQRLWTLVLVAVLALAALVLTTGGVLAQANSTGVTAPYTSRLTDDAGQPLNGTYAFTFALYDAPTAGQLLWAETRSAVAVQNGDFALALGEVQPIPKGVAERKELWLAVSVRGPDETTFTLLTPRQKFGVTGGGGSTLTCPHSHFNDSWSGSNYGSNGLAVTNAGGGDGIDAYSYATRTNWAAV